MNKSTVISRFTESFGSPKPSKTGSFIVGSNREQFGLTTNLKECIRLFLAKYGKSANLQIVNPLLIMPELSYKVNGNVVWWPQGYLLDGFHVLDNKPFQRIQIHYFPNEILPLSISRTINNEQFAVMIAPHVIDDTPIEESKPVEEKKFKGNPWFSGKPKPEWIRPLTPDTTFWLVQYQYEGMNVQQIAKCKKCGVEMLLNDWLNKATYQSHPWCMCSCDTYDDFCGCIRNRILASYEKKWRSVQLIRHWKRKWD